MKRFTPTDEPAHFDARCRRRGRAWLAANPTYQRPKDYWSEFEPELREAFSCLCAYCVMLTMKGQVDHFVPVAVLSARREDHEVYEWRNFRYSEGVINQRKSSQLVLDPFEVRDHWFQIHLPSLQLALTPAVPARHRKLAAFTLERLGLRDSEVIVRYRQTFFELYREGKLTIEGLNEVAPLIAAAVQRDLTNGLDWRR
jgi:hypothetical protein